MAKVKIGFEITFSSKIKRLTLLNCHKKIGVSYQLFPTFSVRGAKVNKTLICLLTA